MALLSVQIPDSLKLWVQKKVERGDYSTPSELVRSILREKKAEEEDLLDQLEQMLLEGFESGSPKRLTKDNLEEWKASMRKKLDATNTNRS